VLQSTRAQHNTPSDKDLWKGRNGHVLRCMEYGTVGQRAGVLATHRMNFGRPSVHCTVPIFGRPANVCRSLELVAAAGQRPSRWPIPGMYL